MLSKMMELLLFLAIVAILNDDFFEGLEEVIRIGRLGISMLR